MNNEQVTAQDVIDMITARSAAFKKPAIIIGKDWWDMIKGYDFVKDGQDEKKVGDTHLLMMIDGIDGILAGEFEAMLAVATFIHSGYGMSMAARSPLAAVTDEDLQELKNSGRMPEA